MPACWYMEENSLAAMLATKRSACVAPELNLRECVTHMPLPRVNKAAHSGFETQKRYHQKSKTGVPVAPQKDLGPPKIKKKYSSFELMEKSQSYSKLCCSPSQCEYGVLCLHPDPLF